MCTGYHTLEQPVCPSSPRAAGQTPAFADPLVCTLSPGRSICIQVNDERQRSACQPVCTCVVDSLRSVGRPVEACLCRVVAMAAVAPSALAAAQGPAAEAGPAGTNLLAFNNHVSDGQIVTACAAPCCSADAARLCQGSPTCVGHQLCPAVRTLIHFCLYRPMQACTRAVTHPHACWGADRLWVAAAAGITFLVLFGAARSSLYTYITREVPALGSAVPVAAAPVSHFVRVLAGTMSMLFQ